MNSFTVMFVDIVDSTKLKHQHSTQDAFNMTMWLFNMVQKKGPAGAKFTGDGGMMVFPESDGGCLGALYAAEEIIQEIDRLNFSFRRVAELDHTQLWDSTNRVTRTGVDIRLQVRIGIATGQPTQISFNPLDVIGTEADLAARLCGEADPDSILVDRATKETAIKTEQELEKRFLKCEHRLQLKGIPIEVEGFYQFLPERLVSKPADGPYVGGVLSLFAHRKSLNKTFGTGRIIKLAAENSILLVAGRTLKFWATKVLSDTNLLTLAGQKKLQLRFLMSSQDSCKYLDKFQIEIISKDRPEAIMVFMQVHKQAGNFGFDFQVRETEHLFLDGMVYGEIVLPGQPTKDITRIVLQDINATDIDVQTQVMDTGDDPKATVLLACICRQAPERRKYCKVCGLHDRTMNIFEHHARELQ